MVVRIKTWVAEQQVGLKVVKETVKIIVLSSRLWLLVLVILMLIGEVK